MNFLPVNASLKRKNRINGRRRAKKKNAYNATRRINDKDVRAKSFDGKFTLNPSRRENRTATETGDG